MHTHPRLEATGSDNGEALKGLAPGNQEVKVAYEETKLVETQGRGTSYLSTWAGASPLWFCYQENLLFKRELTWLPSHLSHLSSPSCSGIPGALFHTREKLY